MILHIRLKRWFLASILVAAPITATVAAGIADEGPVFAGRGADNLSHPLGDAQAALRARALAAKLQGKAKGKTHEVARGQYVELGLEKTDRVFVILAEFGAQIHSSYGGAAGPMHNEIAQPNRAVDNTTIWQADYDKTHYENMYFTQMVDYYKKQSSGRYTINGRVIDWVRVPYNEARYGNNSCNSNVCSTVWYLIRDAINQWVADRKAAGLTNQQIHDELAEFDKWDRYDADGDGNFDEPDGYIDHFQIVHAGEGEETGGGAQGSNAIWSHRWYTAYQGIGAWGPPGAPQGGMEFGGAGTFGNLGGPDAVGIWVGDYTMQPENGGLGVFAHEYAHDLGLPDQYDTNAGENSTGFWTIMSSGSYLGDGTTDLGSRPGDFSAWEKFQLGWLNYEVGSAGAKSQHKLGPAEANTKQAQGLFVLLPDKQVTQDIADPYAGSYFYYSGAGNNLDNTMARSVTLPGGTVTLNAQVNYQIELDWDYAYLTVNGAPVLTNLSTNTNPNGQNFGNGITGASSGNWIALNADLSAYAGQTVTIGFRYWTDGAVVEPGFMVDNLAVTGQALDGAEASAGWAFAGFKTTTGTEVAYYFNAYVAEFRQYRDYDTGLATGPYNFGFLNTLPDYVEHFPYQDGLLVSYWDSSFTDNNTSQHPGGGLILPVDAHPQALVRPDSFKWRSRVQAFDSTFSLAPTDPITLHLNGVPSNIPSLPGVSTFNDLTAYWDPRTPLANGSVPRTGTTIRISSVSAQGSFMQVQVAPAK
jgi:immune inhibitor A